MTIAANPDNGTRHISLAQRGLAALARWPADRLLSASEQVLTSLISMIALIIFSRLMDVPAFGILGGALGIALIVQFIHDSMTVSPFIVVCADPRSDRRAVGDWLLWHFLVAAGMSGALFGIGLALLEIVPGFAQQVILAGPILLGASIYSYSRRAHYHWGEFGPLILQTTLYGAIYAVGLALCWSLGWTSSTQAALVIALSYGLPGAIFCLRNCLRAEFSMGVFSRIRASGQLIASMGGSSALWQSSYASAQLLLSLVGTPAAVAIFTVTRILERPIGLIISSVLDVDTSRAVRALANGGTESFVRVVRQTALILPALSSLPIVLMLAFPGVFLELLYGESYAGATFELQLRILVLVPLLATAPLSVGLTVLRDTGFLLRANLAGLLGGVLFLLGCHLFSTIDAAAANASLIVMQVVILPLLLLRYRTKIRQLRTAEASP